VKGKNRAYITDPGKAEVEDVRERLAGLNKLLGHQEINWTYLLLIKLWNVG
jgi:hypothetical protein